MSERDRERGTERQRERGREFIEREHCRRIKEPMDESASQQLMNVMAVGFCCRS